MVSMVYGQIVSPNNSVVPMLLYNSTAYVIKIFGSKLFLAVGSSVTMAAFLCKVEKHIIVERT